MRSKSTRKPIIVLSVSLLLLLCVYPIATRSSQKQPPSRCTTLTLRLPTYKVAVRRPIVLSADVSGAKAILGEEEAKGLRFKWSVPQTVVISGQGTHRIMAELVESGAKTVQDICVDVEVIGLPPECANRITQSLKIDSGCSAPIKFDEYGDVPFDSEKSHLDKLAQHLKAEPDAVGYIVIYAGQNACMYEANSRGNRARKYLSDQRGVRKNQIEFIDGGFKNDLTTELYLSPRNGCGPLPVSELMSDDVTLTKPCGFGEIAP